MASKLILMRLAGPRLFLKRHESCKFRNRFLVYCDLFLQTLDGLGFNGFLVTPWLSLTKGFKSSRIGYVLPAPKVRLVKAVGSKKFGSLSQIQFIVSLEQRQLIRGAIICVLARRRQNGEALV